MAIQGSTSYPYGFSPGPPGGFAMGQQTVANSQNAISVTLDTLQRGMGSTFLNTSRSSIDIGRLAGLKNDDAVSLQGQRHLLKTRISPGDRWVEKTAEWADYVPQATQDALTNALRWGLLGGASVSAGTATTFLLLNLCKIEEKTPPGFRRMATMIYGACSGLGIGVGGFIYSLLMNLCEVRMHLNRDPAEQKLKERF